MPEIATSPTTAQPRGTVLIVCHRHFEHPYNLVYAFTKRLRTFLSGEFSSHINALIFIISISNVPTCNKLFPLANRDVKTEFSVSDTSTDKNSYQANVSVQFCCRQLGQCEQHISRAF